MQGLLDDAAHFRKVDVHVAVPEADVCIRPLHPQPVCFVQVNVGDEAQKGGCPIAELPALLALSQEAQLPVQGLMCIPPADVEPAPYFALLAKLARRHGVASLSMGMSSDFETAVMVGATHVRVGTALFGERS